MTQQITRIPWVDAPGVERPTSTKVNLDPSILSTKSVVDYVRLRKVGIATIIHSLVEGYIESIGGYRSKFTGEDRLVKWLKITSAIDAIRFFNGDKPIERLTNMAEVILSPETHSQPEEIGSIHNFFDLLDEAGLLDEGENPIRDYTPEEQTRIDDGKRAAQAYERQQREKNKARRKANRKK
jgi:hypothetical protein